MLANKRMLRDRVVSLLEVNIYPIRRERRFVSNVMLTGRDGDAWLARANYMLVHTDNEGRSSIFSVGEYRDRIVESADGLRLRERQVIADTFLVPSHLPSEAGPEQRNAVGVRRLEEKLGLHGSPTCALTTSTCSR